MTDIAEALLTAQDAALRASSEFASAMGTVRIYTVVPPNAQLDYLVLGDDQVIDDSDECNECSEVVSTVHVWTKPEAPQAIKARRIANVVRLVLNAALVLVDHEIVEHRFEESRFRTDPDGSTHVILVFRYLTVRIPIESEA